MCHLWPRSPLRSDPKELVPSVPGTGPGRGGTLLLGPGCMGCQETQGREGLQAGSAGYTLDIQGSGAVRPPCWLGCGDEHGASTFCLPAEGFLGKPKVLEPFFF